MRSGAWQPRATSAGVYRLWPPGMSPAPNSSKKRRYSSGSLRPTAASSASRSARGTGEKRRQNAGTLDRHERLVGPVEAADRLDDLARRAEGRADAEVLDPLPSVAAQRVGVHAASASPCKSLLATAPSATDPVAYRNGSQLGTPY